MLKGHFKQDFSWSLGLKAIPVTNNISAIFVFNLLFKIEVQLPQDVLILEDLDFWLVKSNTAGQTRLDIISISIKKCSDTLMTEMLAFSEKPSLYT